MSDLDAIQLSLKVSFNNKSLLEQALVHSSYVNENPAPGLTSNERLEFLGDAVLGLAIAERLYRDFPASTEGELTRLRASLVRREVLASMAKTLGLGDYLRLGKGEEASGGRNKPVNLAGALEALVAAIFLDLGLEAARDFVLRPFDAELRELVAIGTEKDYKSQLQELVQARYQMTPTYHVTEVTGPDHDRTFTTEVRVGDTALGTGTGKSKKMAETEAARSALERLSSSFTE